MKNVIITGGGPAGMMAAITAARRGFKVTLVEKNEKLGKKLFITGKGRCNITNAGDSEDLFNSIVTNRKFMFSSFNGFSNYDTLGFFDELGLHIKIERGNRVFPESDHSSDVIGALNRELKRLSVDVRLNTEVKDIIVNGGKATGVVVKCSGKESTIQADNVIVATGGNSYQSTGSTGDGYRFARKLGHSVTPIVPALVPFNVAEDWESDLQGLSLKNVSIVVLDGKQEIYSDFGEMLFTHFGVSGPLILSASSFAARRIKEHPLKLVIDLKPAMSEKELDERILRDFKENSNKQFINSLSGLLPSKLIPVIVKLSKIDARKQVNIITKEERLRLVSLLKGLELTVTGNRGFNEAIITRGGICVKEINPSTMESKKYKGLFFAGEMIDVDALTGGFNLQIAWSTGFLSGQNE